MLIRCTIDSKALSVSDNSRMQLVWMLSVGPFAYCNMDCLGRYQLPVYFFFLPDSVSDLARRLVSTSPS